MTPSRRALAALTLIAAVAPCLPAHGGRYRGPSGLSSGLTPTTGGTTTPGVAGPSTPGTTPSGTSGSGGLSGPTTPGTSAPRTGAATSAPAARGVPVGEDLTTWTIWWEFNNDAVLALRDTLRRQDVVPGSDEFFLDPDGAAAAEAGRPPNEKEIRDWIVPALASALRRSNERDIRSACLVALAKIGRDGRGIDLIETLREQLASNEQEVRETAALALGVSQRVEATNDLMLLAIDSPQIHAAMGGRSVDPRTRSFALFGLGLLARDTGDAAVRENLLRVAGRILAERDLANRNLQAAAVNALGLLRPPADERLQLMRAAKALEDFWFLDLGKGDQVLQAQVPIAIARLMRSPAGLDDDALRRIWQKRFVELLETSEIPTHGGQRRDAIHEIRQSAVLALGAMSEPIDDPKKITAEQQQDLSAARILSKLAASDHDQQTRGFAFTAMAEQGGSFHREQLLATLETGTDLDAPWAAVALGRMVFAERRTGNEVPYAKRIGEQLERRLDAKNPYVLGAVALSLGLVGHRDADEKLLAILRDREHQDQLAGHVSIALAMLDSRAALPDLRRLLTESIRRSDRLRQVATALGMLRDREAKQILIDLLDAKERIPVSVVAAVAGALGWIGDHEAIEPLIGILSNQEATPLARAFAAAAIGGVGDPRRLPWNAPLAAGSNYRSAIDTLFDGAAGVLDIL